MSTVTEQAARDFELSFWFSQGRSYLQRKLFQTLGREYAMLYSDETLLEFGKRDHHSPQGLTPHFPHGHERHRPEDIKGELALAWQAFRRSVIWGESQDNTPKNYQKIASLMVIQDRRFMSVGRFALTDFQPDPYASFFRNYVLLDTPTTSVTFDATFRDMRGFLPEIMDESEDLVKKTLALQVLWQERHPEDNFGSLPITRQTPQPLD